MSTRATQISKFFQHLGDRRLGCGSSSALLLSSTVPSVFSYFSKQDGLIELDMASLSWLVWLECGVGRIFWGEHCIWLLCVCHWVRTIQQPSRKVCPVAHEALTLLCLLKVFIPTMEVTWTCYELSARLSGHLYLLYSCTWSKSYVLSIADLPHDPSYKRSVPPRKINKRALGFYPLALDWWPWNCCTLWEAASCWGVSFSLLLFVGWYIQLYRSDTLYHFAARRATARTIETLSHAATNQKIYFSCFSSFLACLPSLSPCFSSISIFYSRSGWNAGHPGLPAFPFTLFFLLPSSSIPFL